MVASAPTTEATPPRPRGTHRSICSLPRAAAPRGANLKCSSTQCNSRSRRPQSEKSLALISRFSTLSRATMATLAPLRATRTPMQPFTRRQMTLSLLQVAMGRTGLNPLSSILETSKPFIRLTWLWRAPVIKPNYKKPSRPVPPSLPLQRRSSRRQSVTRSYSSSNGINNRLNSSSGISHCDSQTSSGFWTLTLASRSLSASKGVLHPICASGDLAGPSLAHRMRADNSWIEEPSMWGRRRLACRSNSARQSRASGSKTTLRRSAVTVR